MTSSLLFGTEVRNPFQLPARGHRGGDDDSSDSDDDGTGATGRKLEWFSLQKEHIADFPQVSAMGCDICGPANNFPDAIEITPVKKKRTYRLLLPHQGLFRCSETGIQFRVTTRVLICFTLDSWDKYMDEILENRSEMAIAGPLFNIKMKPNTGEVSAVYLPHYVCLKAGNIDASEFKICHIKDDDMILETPTSVDSFHVSLKYPSFSLMGVILKFARNVSEMFHIKIPTHACVFLYRRSKTFHLYIMPRDPSIKQAVHAKEQMNGFQWIDKPPQTKTVYTQLKYIVEPPPEGKVKPESLMLQYNDNSQLYPYSEIYLMKMTNNIQLKVTSKEDKTVVWESELREDDLQEHQIKQKPVSDKEDFIRKNYAPLSKRMGCLNPILLDLIVAKVITEHEEEEISRHGLSLVKNRALLDMIIRKNAVRELYDALKRNDPYLVNSLEE